MCVVAMAQRSSVCKLADTRQAIRPTLAYLHDYTSVHPTYPNAVTRLCSACLSQFTS